MRLGQQRIPLLSASKDADMLPISNQISQTDAVRPYTCMHAYVSVYNRDCMYIYVYVYMLVFGSSIYHRHGFVLC